MSKEDDAAKERYKMLSGVAKEMKEQMGDEITKEQDELLTAVQNLNDVLADAIDSGISVKSIDDIFNDVIKNHA